MNLSFLHRSKYKKSRLILAAAVLSAVIVLVALIAIDRGNKLVVVKADFASSQSGGRTIAGIIKNRTDRSYSPVRAEIELLDEKGNTIGATSSITPGLAGGEVWNFEVFIYDEATADFRIKAVSPQNSR